MCPECGHEQPTDAFDLMVTSPNVASERATQREALAIGLMFAVIAVLYFFKRFNGIAAIAMLSLGTIIAFIIARAYTALERRKGRADLHVLFNATGVQRIDRNGSLKQIAIWHRHLQTRWKRIGQSRWSLHLRVPSLIFSDTPALSVRLTFHAFIRKAARIRRFINDHQSRAHERHARVHPKQS